MADPVSAVLALASLAAVTVNMTQMTRLLFKTQDPKVWTIGIRLAVEQARTEEWARRMGVQSYADIERLRTQLPSESARVIVVTIWHGLVVWTEKAKKRFQSYGWDMTDPNTLTEVNTKHPRTPKGWAKRYDWVATGYPDLLELVDTLTALNDGLEKIVPPPPGYKIRAVSGPSVASADSDMGFTFDEELVNTGAYRRSTQMSSPGQVAPSFTSSLPEVSQLSLLEVKIPPVPQQSNPLNPSEATMDSFEAPTHPISFHPTIAMLFSTSQKSLQLIVSRMHSAAFRSIALRVKVLSLDYFGRSPTIDELLNPHLRQSQLLRKNVIGILGDICATFVHILQSMKGQSSDLELDQQRNQLVVILGLDEIAQETMEEPDIMSGPHYSAEFMEFCEVRLHSLLDCLYDTLFSIGTLREIALMEKAPVPIENIQLPAIATSSENSLQEDTASKLAQATQISISTRESDDHKAKIQAREQEDVKQEDVKQEDVKQGDIKQEDVKQEDVKQETQRLERWANAVEDSLRVGLTSQSETLQKAIFINLNQITTALGRMTPPVKPSKKIENILTLIPRKCRDMDLLDQTDSSELSSNKDCLAHVRACIDALSKLEFSIRSAACDAMPSAPRLDLYEKKIPISGKGKVQRAQGRDLIFAE